MTAAWHKHRNKKAFEVREAVGKTSGEYLLDVDRLAEDLGLALWDYSAKDQCEGSFLTYDGANKPQIYVNREMDFRWQRWHIALQIAHVLLHLEPGVASTPPRLSKEEIHSLKDERTKMQSYALKLLIPPLSFREPYTALFGDTKILSDLYGVPEKVYIIRANELFAGDF